ncbi:UbiA-like protein EboC [Euzebyella saccharophila]|uniref:UbiA-like protein EboC n=1 Tax=Euzebyella saccharophila TaxID=679664 RepID=A0ABV8JIT8_9FLAO|nr:UbiA-like protein EboC [Euzebyella saccharophila]MDO1499457.1 UbiA-like protein EboC [Winogradskyella maritima]
MNKVVLGYARLARPANLPTAAADIFAGTAIGGLFISKNPLEVFASELGLSFLFLVVSSIFLYAGGVIMNDVFDYRLDLIERPERPIPSGVVPLVSASIFGAVVLLLGVTMAFLVSLASGAIATTLALSILLYDGLAKKHGFFGPLIMGICRGLNLILGMSILGLLSYAWLALIPVIYIFAITLISRGEVHGNNKGHIVLAGVLYSLVILAILLASFLYTESILGTFIYLGLFAYMIFRPLIKAYSDNSPKNIKGAVMGGVISLIIMDAALGATFSVWWYGLVILLLLPISKGLAKMFAVT